MIDYDEFSMFADNATEVGLPYAGTPAVRDRRPDAPEHARAVALQQRRTVENRGSETRHELGVSTGAVAGFRRRQL